jgi:hypothetical protein
VLQYVPDPGPADWLAASMTTFAESVASFVPGTFEAYARVYHPFEDGGTVPARTSAWAPLAAARGVELHDPAAAAAFAYEGVHGAQPRVGTLPRALIGPLLDQLRPATPTPERCFFATWDGLAAPIVRQELDPVLELPHRRYHVFRGPIEAARTNFSSSELDHRSANLWWPADRAWCVATEIDFAWTYVGAARPCVRALLADPRIEAVETTALSRW